MTKRTIILIGLLLLAGCSTYAGLLNTIYGPSPITVNAAQVYQNVPFQVTVNEGAGFLGRIHFSSGAQALLPWDYTFTAADAGSHQFTVVSQVNGVLDLTVAPISGAGPSGTAYIAVAPAPVAQPLPLQAVNSNAATDGTQPLLLTADNETTTSAISTLGNPGSVLWQPSCNADGKTVLAAGPLCLTFFVGMPASPYQRPLLDFRLCEPGNAAPPCSSNETLQFVDLNPQESAALTSSGQNNPATNAISLPILTVGSPTLSIPAQMKGSKLFLCDGTQLTTDAGYAGRMGQRCQNYATNVTYELSLEYWVPSDPYQISTPWDGAQAGQWQQVPPDPGGPGVQSYPASSRFYQPLDVSVALSFAGQNPASQAPPLTIELGRPDSFVRVGIYYRLPYSYQQANVYPQQPGTHPVSGTITFPDPAYDANDTTLPPPCTAQTAGPCVDYPAQGVSNAVGHPWIWGPPFLVRVNPTGLTQGKVQPYVLVYQPPGADSEQDYLNGVQTSWSSGFTLAQGSGTTVASGTSSQQLIGVAGSAGGPTGSLVPTLTVNGNQSQQWSQQTQTTNLVSTGGALTEVQSSFEASKFPAKSHGSPIAPACNWPSTTASDCPPIPYIQQPFWGDRIFLLVHPQFAFWNFSRCASGAPPSGSPLACPSGDAPVQLIAQRLIGADPTQGSPSVADLYQCLAPGGSYTLPGENGTPGDTLTPDECYDLLRLDPFFMGNGQSTAPPASRAVPAQVPASLQGFGDDPNNPGNPLPDGFLSQTTTSVGLSSSLQQLYRVSQEDSYTACGSGGGGIAPLTFSGNACNSQGNGTILQVTQGATNGITQSLVENISGTMDDYGSSYFNNAFNSAHSYATSPPHITIWADGVYGTWMFQMPNASTGPAAGSYPPPTISSIVPASQASAKITWIANCDGCPTSTQTNTANAFIVAGQNLARPTRIAFGASVPANSPSSGIVSYTADGTMLQVMSSSAVPSGTRVVVTTPSGASQPYAF